MCVMDFSSIFQKGQYGDTPKTPQLILLQPISRSSNRTVTASLRSLKEGSESGINPDSQTWTCKYLQQKSKDRPVEQNGAGHHDSPDSSLCDRIPKNFLTNPHQSLLPIHRPSCMIWTTTKIKVQYLHSSANSLQHENVRNERITK